MLLTGSPYAKDIDNINNQLFLLPHTAENRALFPEFVDDARSWSVNETDEFIHLPVASQLTTPHVARYYGQQDGEDIYITFGQEKRYIPKVKLHSINFPLPLEEDLAPAIIDRYFDLNTRNPMHKETIQRLVRVAWASSILAIRETLKRVIDTPGGENDYQFDKLEFLWSREERQKILTLIIKKLEKIKVSDDLKLQALCSILGELQKKKEKAIVFCERRATVVYLLQALNELMKSLKVVATINEIEPNKYEMKETKEIEELIKRFAPVANDAKDKYQEDYDVFISTDAHGVGVNMQDASVVINYDIDWTPIGPVQRAGRILRFWHSPRTVEVYTFVPKLTAKTVLKYDLSSIQQRWENLMDRHGESRKLIDLPVLTNVETQEINPSDVASEVTIASGELDLEKLADLDISPYYKHTAKLQTNREEAKEIPADIISAKTYTGKQPLVYVLLNHDHKYYWPVYNPETQTLQKDRTVVKLLDLIACTEETETAIVDYDRVEEFSDACIQAWCREKDIKPEEVVRECVLYLKPEDEGDAVDRLFNA